MRKGSKKPRRCACCLAKISRTKSTNLCRICETKRTESARRCGERRRNHIMAVFARDYPHEIPPITDLRMVPETRFRYATLQKWGCGESVTLYLLNIEPHWCRCWGRKGIFVWGDRLKSPVYGRPACDRTEALASKYQECRREKEAAIKREIEEKRWQDRLREVRTEASKDMVVSMTRDKSASQFFAAMAMAGAVKGRGGK